MTDNTLSIEVRPAGQAVSVIDIKGDVTADSEDVLTDAYTEASAQKIKAIVLNFTGLDYMNSSGIGLLVTLLVRANRQRQKVIAYGLNEHYRQIFQLTRLDEAISICDDEATALRTAGA